jgi:hypothetical protein
MQLKGKVTRLAKAAADALKYLDEAQGLMKDMGLECNDKTILQKIAEVDIKTILTEGKGVLENAKDIYDLVSAIAA